MKINLLKLILLLGIHMSTASAQLSEYQQTYLKHAKVVKNFHRYIDDFPVFINTPPPHATEMVRSVGVVYAMLHDGVEANFEGEARIDFTQNVVQSLINDYPALQQQIDQSINQVAAAHNSGRPYDAGDENELKRIRLAIEHDYFALPMVMFEGKTPYHDMYRQLLDAYQLYINGPGGTDLSQLSFYQTDDLDFGSTEVVSLAAKNQAIAAQKTTQKTAFENRQGAHATQKSTDAENSAFIEQTSQYAIQAQKDAQMLINRTSKESPGFGWFNWLLILTLSIFTAWWFREKLPVALKTRIEFVGHQLVSWASRLQHKIKNHINHWRNS